MSSYICHAWHVTWRKYRHVIVTKPTKDDDDNIDYYFTTYINFLISKKHVCKSLEAAPTSDFVWQIFTIVDTDFI